MTTHRTKDKERGRPLGFSKEKLIEHVTELFWTHGYNELSLNTIAQKTGLKRSSLYNSFKTKEALFLECLQYYGLQSPTRRLEEYQDGESVSAMLHQLFEDISEKRANDSLRRGCLVLNTYCEQTGNNTDSDIAKKLQANSKKRQLRVTHIMQCAIEKGELLENEDPKLLASIILSFLNGLSIQAKNGASSRELKAMSHLFLNKLGFANPADMDSK